MKKMTIMIGSIIIIIISIIIVIMNAKTCEDGNAYSTICVPSEDIALKLTDVICREVYPEIDYSKYYARAVFQKENDAWLVSYALVPRDSNIAIGGGGPAILMDAKTAKILEFYLQK